MVKYLYDKNIILYTFGVLCGVGLLVRLIVNLVYRHLVKESDNLGETKNKMLKHIKMKFETCFKLKIGVNNVDTFVDKNVLRYRFCGVLLSTWDNLSGQVLFLNLLIVPVCAVFGVAEQCGQDRIMFMGAVGILSSAILILVDKSINLPGKKKILRLNLLDYLENFCKVRLEQEAVQPELIEQYRREYLQSAEARKQISAAVEQKKEEPKDELNRRREARLKKEEERKLQAVKREEEQHKLEEARREEEKRKLEERRQLAAKRREEERQKLEEEREALEARRAEIKRKAEEKQLANEKKQQRTEEKVQILHNIEDDIKPSDNQSTMEPLMKGLEEITAEKDKASAAKSEELKAEEVGAEGAKTSSEKTEAAKTSAGITGRAPADRTEKEKVQKPAAMKSKFQGMSLQEEKIIEDVLKEFFA